MTIARVNFVELPSKKFSQSKSFYSQVFGWSLTDFGPTYSCTMSGDVDIGLQGDGSEATAAPLAVVAVENLEEALAAVLKAGGTVSRPIFSFPGGRRFHFLDPNGNELAVLKSG
jgi:predicted enzyme related to lactoylglutathione lyase